MSQTRAENFKSSTRDCSEDTQRGVKPKKSSGGGAEEEGYRKGDVKSSNRYEWKDSPYNGTDWYVFSYKIWIIIFTLIIRTLAHYHTYPKSSPSQFYLIIMYLKQPDERKRVLIWSDGIVLRAKFPII